MSATADFTPETPAPAPVTAPAAEATAGATAEPQRTETDRLAPEPVQLTLMSGTAIEIEPLKLRQFLRLLKILTRGASGVLDSVQLSNDMDPAVFTQQLIAMVLLAIPEAEDETIDFLKTMVRPATKTGNAAADAKASTDLWVELDNPELEDTVTIIETIVKRESGDLRALGKRLGSMMETARKMGATK